MRNALALVPKGAQQMVAATIRTVFFQPDAENARATWRRVADGFRPHWPRLAQLLDLAEDEVLTYLAFPKSTGARCGRTTRRKRKNRQPQRVADALDRAICKDPQSGVGE